MKRLFGWVFKLTGALAVFGLLAGLVAVTIVGGWIALDDQPRKADAIVVLGGGYYRPLYAADLYAKGYAPQIYVVRPHPAPGSELLPEAGVLVPPQHEIYRRLLIRRGVPHEAIHIYGTDVQSTAEEASTLAAILGDVPRTLLVVTSPYHVPRAKLIFERAMPSSTVIAVGTPYEPFPKPWWSKQYSAVRVVNETAKLAWYILGGRFMSKGAEKSDNETPTTPAPSTGPAATQ